MKLSSIITIAALSVFAARADHAFAINFKRNNKITADTNFKVANVFQSDMVIQQDKPYAIWGKATAGNTITISGDWTDKQVSVIADKTGYWKGFIPVPKAVRGDFKAHSITIADNDSKTVLVNLLIGDVWLASGQSNMQFGIKGNPGKDNGVIDYEKVIAEANYPNIRWLYVDLNFKAQPYDQVTGKWVICSPETVGHFSGVAYFYARSLYQHLNIPIGIVLSNIGASTGQAWTSRKELESDTVLVNKYLKDYDASPKSKEVINAGFSFEKVTRPTLLYNAMIHPLAGLSIKGFIWYQGEFNHTDKWRYTLLEEHMIKGWREDFGQGDLPFYFVQMPSYFWNNNDPKADDYALFREAQANIRTKVKNTGMAVTLDDNVPRLLHPRNKKPVGERLARIALNNTYKMKNVLYLGPQYKKMKVTGNKVEISYSKESLDGGLMTNDTLAPRQFFVAGADHKFHGAKATIKGDNVVLQSDSVADPVAVRFAFTNMAVVNLFNKEGLPAEPFRTDDWADEVVNPKINLDYKKLNEGK